MANQYCVIRRLDETVVNRIAAGEVIQRPANAIKEMIENCIDAKATTINVTVKEGGLKLIQIQDNGTGIQKEDLEIVCERFTTSKLTKFEDLNSISTYGFRGEALASISHVSHVTIISKTADSRCAYKGVYVDGKLKSSVVPSAGNQGTIIMAEDLFYNVSTRRRTLKSGPEEHARIIDVINRYAVHNSGISFSLKKQGTSMSDVKTPTKSNIVDNIRIIYGAAVAKELVPVEAEDPRLGMKVSGYVTNANYSMKKGTFLLFINHRLVECSQLHKAIDTVYGTYLPKGTYPFLYLSLEILPSNIDVNVHPTKYEVHFLHQDAVISAVQNAVEQKLLGGNASRAFYTQSLIALPKAGKSDDKVNSGENGDKEKTTQVYNMVRTDPTNQKLETFLQAKRQSIKERPTTTSAKDDQNENTSPPSREGNQSEATSAETPTRQRVSLSSIISLRKKVDEHTHPKLREMIKDHTFVGCVDKTFTLIQHLTKLYLVNNKSLTQELFYQIILNDFANLNMLKLSSPAPIYDLILLALELPEVGWTEADGPKTELAKYASRFLTTKADMLNDYFSIDIDEEGNLLTLPHLLPGYMPELDRIPLLVIRLATEVNWEKEKECLESIAEEIASFYALQKPLFPGSQETPESENWKSIVEHTVFPRLRSILLPSNQRAEDVTFLEVANLPNLYRVFERC